MHLPGDARGEVIHRGVLIDLRLGADAGVPVGIDHVGRGEPAGGIAQAGGRRGQGVRGRSGGSRVGTAQSRQGLLARDAVHRQAVSLLEFLQRLVGQHAEVAVSLARQVAQADQPLLHQHHGVADITLAQGLGGGQVDGRGGRRGGRGRAGDGGGVEQGQGLVAGLGVPDQAVGLLEGVDRLRRLRAELAVRLTGQVPQVDQPLLHGRHRVAAVALLQGGEGFHRAAGNGAGVGDGGLAVQLDLRVVTGDAVGGQAVLLLEGLDGRHVIGLAGAVRIGGVVAQLGQTVLQAGHLGIRHAQGDLHHVILGDGRIGGHGSGRGNRRGGGSRLLVEGQRAVAEQQLIGAAARHAVSIQAVLGLEGLQRSHAAGAELAIHRTGVVAQILQPLLHQLRVLA